ncbi:MAG TPA: hypothetical protein VJ777_30215 [Mycobacterium sp.]|nr:hypothetical protein [Mycobacterium sp.]
MTVTVSTVQRASLRFNSDSTVLDLVQALTENLDGEWDNAKLRLASTSAADEDDVWVLEAVLSETSEPNRPEVWRTHDGEHVAAPWAPPETLRGGTFKPVRKCSCGVYGDDARMSEHMTMVAGKRWSEE